MTRLRRLVHQHILLAWLAVAAVLAIKLLVPAGFMPVTAENGTITIQICSGTRMGPMTMEVAVPGLPARHGDHQTPAKAEMPCAFTGLAMPMMAGTDPLLLALAIAFVMAIMFRSAASPPLPPSAYLRPPLRGPPTTA